MALALATAQVLFANQQHDSEAHLYCDHLDEFKTLAFSRSLSDWADLADVDVTEINSLAEMIANSPTAILVGWGMQRRNNGCATIRVLDALAAISGNLGIAGGGISFYFNRRGAFDLSFLRGIEVAPRTIPEPLLGPGILEASDPPIRMVWVTAANPVAMLPESRTVAQALKSRELTVVVDSFLTDSAQCADVVLPTTTMLEDDDLLGAYGHHWLAESRPVVTPPIGVKSDDS
jgi:anaerobic selenocysteine-containing dehydrogenase